MCTSSCVTQDHATYGECLRAKNLRVAYCGIGGGDASVQKRWDADLDAYKAARRQGIQPAGTSRQKVADAVAVSNQAGRAYDASTHTFTDKGV